MQQEHKQKVLIVHNYYQIPGGEDTVVANERKLLEDHGHEVLLYSRSNNEIKKMNKLKLVGLPLITIFNPKTYRDIKKIIKQQNIEIVHVHNTLTLISPAVYYAATKCRIPVIQTIHNFRMLCPGATFYRDGHICEDCVSKGLGCAIKHKCYRSSFLQTLLCVINTKIHRATGIYKKINYICLTEFNKTKLLQLKEISDKQVFIKPNFVNNVREIIPFEKRKKQFIYVGRLDKLKGIDVLLKAWKLLGDNDEKLLICGTGPMEEWCCNYIKKNNLNVEMLGLVDNERAIQLIANSKALVLPTRWYEGFPMTIVEAYSVGTPVIGSDIGNVGDIVIEGITGSKCLPDDYTSIIYVIKGLMDKKNIYGTTIREYETKYTGNRNYELFSIIYNSILNRRNNIIEQ